MPDRNRPRPAVLAIILVSYLMIVLDISIVITALPHIHSALHFSAANLSWVQSAYTLAFGGLLLLGARAGDILGRRRMFTVGIAIFSAASLLVGVAPVAGWLIAARVLQGVGAAVIAPSTLALLTTNFPEGVLRTKAVAYYGAVAGIGASLGLVLGGILTTWVSWRVGFFINVPVGAAMLILTPRHIAESERRSGRFDVVGAATSTVGMAAIVYGIIRSSTSGWTDDTTLFALALGVVLLLGFVANEARALQPIMPLRLFADGERVGAYGARFLFLGAMMGFWFFTTQYLQTVLGFSAIVAGLAFLPMTVVNFAVAVAVPRLTAKVGNGRLLALGLGTSLVGMIWLSRLDGHSGYLTAVALPMMLIGAGQGASLSPLTAAGIARVRPTDAGAASGLVNVAHQIGGSIGLAVLVTIFASARTGRVTGRALFAHQASVALTAGAVMLAVALTLVIALIVCGGPRVERTAERYRRTGKLLRTSLGASD
jgi:EmrB/QacA subfamily drug resistance transporter